MLVETVNITGNNPIPTAQGRSPTEKGVTQKGKEGVRAGKGTDLSRLAQAVAYVQKNLDMINNVDLQFSVHKASGEIMVIVTEESTGELIREIPPSGVLNLAAKIDEMIGLIFDQKG